MGSTINLTTANIPSGAAIGISILSLTQYPAPGFDLGALGMPGCQLYAGLDVLNTFVIGGASQASLNVGRVNSVCDVASAASVSTTTTMLNVSAMRRAVIIE